MDWNGSAESVRRTGEIMQRRVVVREWLSCQATT